MFSTEEKNRALTALFSWYDAHKRPLPWRHFYDPYEVLISEVMLQQTQMERGIQYFLHWMDRFPTLASVAKAPEEEILRYWEGLGYYRRARFLHQTAKAVMERFGGALPKTKAELSSLPGLGEYTVAAIQGIAYEQDVVTVDANVERIFSRLFNIESPVRKKPASAWIRATARELLPPGEARLYNQAFMELGALVCGKSPRCPECPLIPWCEARKKGVEKERPVLPARPKTHLVASAHGILLWKNHVLLKRRPLHGLWGGLWEFPGAMISRDATAEATALKSMKDLGLSVEIITPLGQVQHNYTHHRLTAHFFRMKFSCEFSDAEASLLMERAPCRFLNAHDMGRSAMPAHHRKMATAFFTKNPLNTDETICKRRLT